MKLSDEWITSLSESDEGETIFISGRTDIEEFVASGKFKERVEITWEYEGNGMPSEKEAALMEEMQTALQQMMEKDKLAILTGIYTGAGERTWVFYTRNIPAFGEKLNEALAPFELLPITIYTEKDPDWNEYREMREAVQ